VPKTYHARVRGVPDSEALRALREGLTLDDGTLTRPATVRVLGTPRSRQGTGAGSVEASTWLEIVLTEGKNRQVRRMGAAVGHDVLDLVRVRIGRLDLGGLAPGEWRELGPGEVRTLLAAGSGR
jgi:23S rRNA pseudouridine2457 synthase